jgi:hypothetical protein
MEMFNYDSIKLHPNFTQIEENVWVIKNFISDEICDSLVEYAESQPEEKWWERNKREWWHGKFLFAAENDRIIKTFIDIKEEIAKLFTEDWFLSDMASIHRMQKGEGMFEHSDNPTEDMGRNNFVELSFVLYISDFKGGEIYYPRIEGPHPAMPLHYKSEKGDLLIHPGVGKYFHGVYPVTSDAVRYVTTAFAYDRRVKELRDKGLVYEDVNSGQPINEITEAQATGEDGPLSE